MPPQSKSNNRKQYSVKEISQLLVHYLLAKKVVPEGKYNEIISKYISKSSPQEKATPELIGNKANEILQEIGFQIQVLTSFRNEKFYVCYSTMDDKLTKSHTWSAKESKLFWALILKMFKNLELERSHFDPDDDYCLEDMFYTEEIGGFDQQDLKGPGLTQLQVQSQINKWLEQQYFELTPRGNMMIGVRTLSEMGPLLAKKFNLLQCKSCKFICFTGFKCNKCSLVYHDKCSVMNKCNECKKDMGVRELLVPSPAGN